MNESGKFQEVESNQWEIVYVSALLECFRPLHTLSGLYPVYWDTNSLVVKSANNNNNPCSKSLTPRKLRLDSHDVLCGRARLVGAQHVHSSKFLDSMFSHSPLRFTFVRSRW